MSEDSDDSRYYESSTNTCPSQPESAPTSPVSPYRCSKPLNGFVPGPTTASYPSHSSIISSSQPRQRGSDTEGRFPSSPSDICHSADLRRAALLRSVQMRTQPLGPSQFEPPLSPGQDSVSNIEAEDRPCSYMKLDVDERAYQIGPLTISEHKDADKSMDLKGDESAGEWILLIDGVRNFLQYSFLSIFHKVGSWSDWCEANYCLKSWREKESRKIP